MKRVIITGASDGLGLELSKLFISKGVEVIGLSRRKPKCDAIHIKTDLSDEMSIITAVGLINKKYSKFDALINCAGVLSIKKIDSIDYNEADNLLKVNVLAPMILVSKLMKHIKKNEADIVNVGSTVGFKAYEDQCAYGSSKWAVRGMNANMQLELKKTKCRVIGFNPGGFKSKIFEKATGIKMSSEGYMPPKEVAKLLIHTLELPKALEVSEIIINRK